MTIHATRAVLLSKLLRSGDRARIARLLDRLEPLDVSRLFAELSDLELRRAGAILFEAARVERTVHELPHAVLARLMTCSTPEDARRALAVLSPAEVARLLTVVAAERRGAVLELLSPEARERVAKMLPRASRRLPSAVFRLRRLFA